MHNAGVALLALLLTIPKLVASLLGIGHDGVDLGDSLGDAATEAMLEGESMLEGAGDAVSNLWWLQRQGAVEKLRKRDYHTTNASGDESQDISPIELFAVNSMVKKVQRQYRQRKGGSSADLPTYDVDLSTVLHCEAALTAPFAKPVPWTLSTRRGHRVQVVLGADAQGARCTVQSAGCTVHGAGITEETSSIVDIGEEPWHAQHHHHRTRSPSTHPSSNDNWSRQLQWVERLCDAGLKEARPK